MKLFKNIYKSLIIVFILLLSSCGVFDSFKQFNVNLIVDQDVIVNKVFVGREFKEPKDPNKEGYSFNGWYYDSEYEEEVLEFPIIINEEISLYAKFDINSYLITYLIDEEEYKEEQYLYDEIINTLEPQKEGFVFLGWDKEVPLKMPSHDLVLNGTFIKEINTITYHFEEEDVLVEYMYNEEVTSNFNPVKEGFTFRGWILEDGTLFSFGNIISSDIDLYPLWAVNYEISFNTLEGIEIDNIIVASDEKITSLPTSYKSGYQFIGWYLDEELSDEFVYGSKINSDITLYAKYELNKIFDEEEKLINIYNESHLSVVGVYDNNKLLNTGFIYKKEVVNNKNIYYGLTIMIDNSLNYLSLKIVLPEDNRSYLVNNYALFEEYNLVVFTFLSEKDYGLIPIDNSNYYLGEDVLSIGYSGYESNYPSLRFGMISNNEDDNYFMIDSYLNVSDRGAPVFNLDGKVIGIFSNYKSYYEELSNEVEKEYVFAYGINYVLNINKYKEFLYSLSIDDISNDLTENNIEDNYIINSNESLQISVIDEIINSNVFIFNENEFISSAVIVKKENNRYYLLTNYKEEIITLFDNLSVSVLDDNYLLENYYYDKEENIIIISFTSEEELNVVSISEKEVVKGVNLIIAGSYDYSGSNLFTNGMVSKDSYLETNLFMVDGKVNYYQLGGGVFNSFGELVGVITSKNYQYVRENELFIIESETFAYKVNVLIDVLSNINEFEVNSSFHILEINNESYIAINSDELAQIELINDLSKYSVTVIGDSGHGSGTIYKKEVLAEGYLYYVLTNKHVTNESGSVSLTLNDKSKYIAYDYYEFAKYDLAIVRFKSDVNLAVKQIKNDDNESLVGQIVYAVGTPLNREYLNVVTKGVISYTEIVSKNENRFLVDISLNPGNSGGGLFNGMGEFIGVNTAKYVNYENGLGSDFARGGSLVINISVLKDEILDVSEEGYIKVKPKIGITVTSLDDYQSLISPAYNPPTSFGLVVTNIDELRNAYGVVEVGDTIIKINGVNIYSTNNVGSVMEGKDFGDILIIELYRYINGDWQLLTVEVVLK